MADRGHGTGGKRPGASPTESGGSTPEPSDRPGAAGHRFGPRLVCSECGIRWDDHQRDRKPCVVQAPAGGGGDDPFARRPPLPPPISSPTSASSPSSLPAAPRPGPSGAEDEAD